MKKFLLSLLVMFVGLSAFATEETVTLTSGVLTPIDDVTGTPVYMTWTAADGNITITQLKALSTTAVSNNTNPPRIYKGQILSFVCEGQYRITNVAFEYGNKYPGAITAGTTVSENTVAADANITYTAGTTSSTCNCGDGVQALYLQNDASSSKQFRPTSIVITYVIAKKPFEAKTIASIDELENNVAYSIHNVNGEGYLVYSPTFSEEYVTVEGVTNESYFTASDASYKNAVDLTSANAAWQIVKYEDNYYLYNIGAKKYVNNVPWSKPYFFTPEVTPIYITDNGDGTFGFRNTLVDTQYLCVALNQNPPGRWWTADDHGSVMQIETVDIDVDDVYETVEAAVEQAKRNSAMAEAIAEAETAYAENFTWGEGLITSADQLSSPYTEPTEGSLAELLDGNQSTFWHSIWSGSMEGTHYLQIELPEAMEGTFEAIIGRRSGAANDHITTMIVKYVIDDVEYDAATLDLPFGSNTETLVRTFNLPTAAKTIRLYNGGTTSGNAYWHMGEFQLKAATAESKNLQNAAVAAALQDAITAAKAVVNASQEDIDALVAATKSYKIHILPDVEAGTYVIAFNVDDVVKVARRVGADTTKSYGYLQTEEAMVYNDVVYISDKLNVFTLAETEGGFTLQDGEGNYLYSQESFNNFNITASVPETGGVWTATVNDDGTVNIINNTTEKIIQYDNQYKNVAAYVEGHKETYDAETNPNGTLLPVLFSKFEANPTFDVTVHECVAELADWTSDGAQETVLNTWSTENDESGMKTPFVQCWIGSGNKLSDATISHTQLTGLAAGNYTVSIFARVFNENNATTPSGFTLFANEESVDLSTGKTATYGASAVLYDNYSVDCTVGEEGTLDLGFKLESVAGNWIAFKNLKVVFHNPEAPELVAVEGKMNVDVAAAQAAALEAYKNAPVPAAYADAAAAVAAAQASADYYAGISAVVENLDEAGKAVFAATENGAAYEASTLTNEDVTADLVAAQKAQTTAGSDMSLVAQTTVWTCPQGNGPGVYNANGKQYTETYNGAANVEGKVMYQHIEGLTRGTYNVTFLATANMAWIGAATGTGIAQIYANDVAEDIEVIGQTGCNPEDYVRSLDVTVGEDGVLEYGMQNIATGGNWYVAKAVSLTLVEKYYPTFEYTIESFCGSCYEGIAFDVELSEILASIEAASMSDVTIYSENADGTRIEGVRKNSTVDGYRDAEGSFSGWGDNGYFYLQDNANKYGEQFYIGGMEGKNTEPASYTAKLVYVNNTTGAEAVVLVHYNYVYPHAVELATSDLVVELSVAYEATDGDYVEKILEFTDEQVSAICTELGIASLDEADIYGYYPSAQEYWPEGYCAGAFDGWRDTNGEFHKHTGNAEVPICAKYIDNKIYCYNIASETYGEYVAYWAIANAEKAVLVKITFTLATAIEAIDAEQNEAKVIFDLSGRRLTKAVKGVNIINGKKVLVK